MTEAYIYNFNLIAYAYLRLYIKLLLSPVVLSCSLWMSLSMMMMKMSAQGGLLQEKRKIQHAQAEDTDIIYAIHTTTFCQLGSSHYDSKEISQ